MTRTAQKASWATTAAVAALLGWASASQAGCPNICQITDDPAQVEPALPSCLKLEYFAEDCNWGVFFAVTNSCAETITVTGMAFDYCSEPGSGLVIKDSPCTSIPTGQTGVSHIKFPSRDGTGRKELVTHLGAKDGDHTVTLRANVISFDKGGCAIAGSPGQAAGAGMLLLMATGLAVRCRRSRSG